MSYTKLANSILTSTIWMEDDHTRIVWLAMLAMADRNGEVQGSIPGLAHAARVPVESCQAAIQKFLSPDPHSRTKDDEGRRIEEIRGGWFLINHHEYRELSSDDDRRRKAADRQQRHRDKIKRNVTGCDKSHQIPHADADADADADAKNTPLPPKGGADSVNGRRRTGKRKRDPLLPITLAEMRDWSALMAWCQRDARIDREATGPVPLIQAAALACGTADEFLATVEAGIIDGNWGSLVGVSQAEFKSRTHGAVK